MTTYDVGAADFGDGAWSPLAVGKPTIGTNVEKRLSVGVVKTVRTRWSCIPPVERTARMRAENGAAGMRSSIAQRARQSDSEKVTHGTRPRVPARSRAAAIGGSSRLSRSPAMNRSYLVDPASSHMLVSKIKPCMSKHKPSHGEAANGSLGHP